MRLLIILYGMPYYFKKIGFHIAPMKPEITPRFSLAFGTGRLYRNCEERSEDT